MLLPEINKILYATDLEGGSSNAFRMAVALAKSNDAQLVILHVMEQISSSVESMIRNTMTKEEYCHFKTRGLDSMKVKLKQKMDEFCEKECPGPDNTYPRGEPITIISDGESSEMILQHAKQQAVDLIVMGTRTHTAIGQMLGSTANKVIHHSSIPVLVYPL